MGTISVRDPIFSPNIQPWAFKMQKIQKKQSPKLIYHLIVSITIFEASSSCFHSPLEALNFWISNDFWHLKTYSSQMGFISEHVLVSLSLESLFTWNTQSGKCPVLYKPGTFLITKTRWVFSTVFMDKTSPINAVFRGKLC